MNPTDPNQVPPQAPQPPMPQTGMPPQGVPLPFQPGVPQPMAPQPGQPAYGQPGAMPPQYVQESPTKDYLLAILLSWLVGSFGVDRFYLGKIGTGVVKLLTLGGFGIWQFVDMTMIVFGKLRGADNLPLKGYAEHRQTFKIIYWVYVGLTAMSLLFFVPFLLISVLATSSGIQGKARDSKRQTDVASMQIQVETYFTQSGYYPSLSDMNNATWREKNMPNLDPEALRDPSNTACDTTTDKGDCLVHGAGLGTKGAYEYDVTDATGASCEGNDQTCAQYKLVAYFENVRNGTKAYTRSALN